MERHIFAGQAQLPGGSDIHEEYKFLSIHMVVDIETGTILDSIVSVYNPLHNNFITDILRGKCLDHDLDTILKQIERTVHTPTRRALITAIQVLFNRYCDVRKRYLTDLGKENSACAANIPVGCSV